MQVPQQNTRLRFGRPAALLGGLLLALGGGASAQVQDFIKLSDTTLDDDMLLEDVDLFGAGVADIGDIDGNGQTDIVVGAPRDNDGSTDKGAVWIFLLETDGQVRAVNPVSDTLGGFTGVIDKWDYFGTSVCSVGDLNGDGVGDIAVGAIGDDDGDTDAGAVWVLFLASFGSTVGVLDFQKISDTQGGFLGAVGPGDVFGQSLANIGDIDGDGVTDLAVGAVGDDDGGTNVGAVWILFMNTDGTVKDYTKLSASTSLLSSELEAGDRFGQSITSVGDLNGDTIPDIAVGSVRDDDGGADRGGVYILLLTTSGQPAAVTKISETTGGFLGDLSDYDYFGSSIAPIGDFDTDGVIDLAVGAVGDDDAGTSSGAIWLLYMNSGGTVKSHQKYTGDMFPLLGEVEPMDGFAHSLSTKTDMNGDGRTDLLVGSIGDDDGGIEKGAAYLLTLVHGTPGSAKIRNGSGVNRVCFTTPDVPYTGQTWGAEVDATNHSSAYSLLFAYDTALDGLATPYGELLIAPEGLGGIWYFTDIQRVFFGYAGHFLDIPDDPAVEGLEVYTQILIYGSFLELCNAIDLVIGFWDD